MLLCVLDSRVAPVSVRELSRAILAFDRSGTWVSAADADAPALDDDADPVAVETMDAQLHHVHLPRLAAVGLLEYEATESVVTNWCHPPVGDRWLTAPPFDQLAEVISDARSPPVRAD